MPEDNELIVLKNSNPLNKYPVDAEQLNYNFSLLSSKLGVSTVKQFIESSGQVYNPIIDNQLATAVTQYVLSAKLFDERGTGNTFKLYAREGFSAPYRYTYGMEVSFIPTRTNTGSMTLQIESLNPYPVWYGLNDVPTGFLSLNTLLTFRFYGNHWELVTGSASTGSTSTGGGSSTSDSTALIVYNQVRDFIVSADLGYTPTDTLLLAKGVAQYVTRSMYKAEYVGSNYTLTPYGNQQAPAAYTEGMTVSFIADVPNSAPNSTISIGSLPYTLLTDFNGAALDINALSADEPVICVFDGSAFKVISQHAYTFSLRNGHKVTTISNDGTLNGNSQTSLVTEFAAKTYIDTKVKSTKTNIIISGYNNALSKASSHTIQLISANNTTGLIEKTPTDTGNILVSGNDAKKVNAISKTAGVYWESEKSGFDIDNNSRVLLGDAGGKYISLQYDTNGNVVQKSGTSASYFGISGYTGSFNQVKIKHTDANHTPDAVVVQVNTSATLSDALWLTMVTPTESTYNTNYGDLSIATTDVNGYYTINVPAYVLNGESVEAFTPTGSYAIRVVPTLFTKQYPTTEAINTAGYDPNNDSTSTQYTWQVIDFIVGYTEEGVPPYVLSYPNGAIETITEPSYFTQYTPNSTDNTVTLGAYSNGRYILYKVYGSSDLYPVLKSLVYTQSLQPEASAATEGGVWINVGTVPYTTYVCSAIQDESGIVTGYNWVATDLILLGGFDILNSNITNVINYRMGDNFVSDYPISATGTLNIPHNFGFDVTTNCYLVCTTANNSYDIGETVVLDLHEVSIYDSVHDTNALSYFLVSNTNINTRIDAYNLKIINRNTHELVDLPNDSWKLRVYIVKD